MTERWTTPDEIAAKVRRRWSDGTLLSALARGEPFPSQDLVIQGPKASEIGADLGAVQQWAAELDRGSRNGARYEIVYGEIGGREFGTVFLEHHQGQHGVVHVIVGLRTSHSVAARRRKHLVGMGMVEFLRDEPGPVVRGRLVPFVYVKPPRANRALACRGSAL